MLRSFWVLERAEDWGAGEGAWERGSEGAGAVLGCLGGSQDFGEADTRFGAVRFLGEALRFSGRGRKGSSGWSKADRDAGHLGPRSPAGPGSEAVGQTRDLLTCRRRSRGACPARTRPPRGSRTAAAPSARAASCRSAARAVPEGPGAGSTCTGGPAAAAGAGRGSAHPYSAAGGRGGGGAVCRLLSVGRRARQSTTTTPSTPPRPPGGSEEIS